MRNLQKIAALLLAWMCLVPAFRAFSEPEVRSAPFMEGDTQSGMVRVYLSSLGSRTGLNVTISGSYTADGKQNVTLTQGQKVSVTFSTGSGNITITVNGTSYAMGQEMVFRRHVLSGENGVRIAESRKPGNLFPGDLQLTAVKSGGSYKLYPIVHVFIEDYLTGVVPYEMGNSAHLESLKAQAVAARTYTLNKMNTRSAQRYDVVDTTNDQVYYGNSSGTEKCTEAVNATKGIVLMNGGALTSTYYTASNGGQTEAAQNVWGAGSSSYLGIQDDPFDQMNPASVVKRATVYRDFQASGQKTSLKTLLQRKAEAQASGAVIETIDDIILHSPKYSAPSRLYTKADFVVTILDADNRRRTLTLTCDVFSELESMLGLGINNSKNELWSVEASGDKMILAARRFGHGVGMSQRGAMQMGQMGYTYDQILGFYYPGCQRVQHTFRKTIHGPVADAPSEVITTIELPADITESGSTAVVVLANNGDRLAMRDAASEGGRILIGLKSGTVVRVLTVQGDWTVVQQGEIIGFVPTNALRISGTAESGANVQATRIDRWAVVSVNGTLNLRSQPGYQASVRTTIPDGAVLAVFSVNGEWARVQYESMTGYAATAFLTLFDQYPAENVSVHPDDVQDIPAQNDVLPVLGYAVVTTESGTLNVRSTPSTAGQVLSTIPKGSSIPVYGETNGWTQIEWNQVRGYVMSRYLSAQDGHADAALPMNPSESFPEEAAVVTFAIATDTDLQELPAGEAKEE